MDMKETCLHILAAESEAEVQKIVRSVPEMRDKHNWKPLDGRDTNFNVTSNQASDGGKALTELMTNMVDAVLMKHAHEKGINPKGPGAPRTMYEAVDRLIKNMDGGKLINCEPDWLREFARKNLAIGVSGAKSKSKGQPCYTFADNGEGQHPENFEKTFLSLSAGTKKDIPFVQGKYNMGSSGVLSFCGDHWFKLIISRRHDKSGAWGWTLMRRRPGNRDALPVAEYFIAQEGGIPAFHEDILHPFRIGDGNPYERVALQTGTIIKLFDYQISTRFLNFKSSRYALNENLVETILPFRIFDFRQTPRQKHGYDRLHGVESDRFYGMEYLLLRSHREDSSESDGKEEIAAKDEIHVGEFSNKEMGKISIRAILLKANIPGWLKPTTSRNRVFHAVNGQVQFKETRGYLTQSCGFPALKDRVVIFVDASHLSFAAHNDIWKGDRENIRNTRVGEKYKNDVTEIIKNSEYLKKLNQKIIEEEFENNTNIENEQIFKELVRADRSLVNLLTGRNPTIRIPASASQDDASHSGAQEWDGGKHSPTKLNLEEHVKKSGITIPINGSRPLGAITDAENKYFMRANNPGHLVISEEMRAHFGCRQSLQDGRLTLYLTPLEHSLAVGDRFTFTIALKDDAIPTPVESEEFSLIVSKREKNPEATTKKKKTARKTADGKNDANKGRTKLALTLPKINILTRDGRTIEPYDAKKCQPWPDGFSEQDGGSIKELSDGKVVYQINYDNVWHLDYRNRQKTELARRAASRKYILGMQILMLGFQNAYQEFSKSTHADSGNIAEFIDEFRRMMARGAASTVLALTDSLPKISDMPATGDDDE